MSSGIQKIDIVPEIGTVVNQNQEFRARVIIANINAWKLTECKLFVTDSSNCYTLLQGIISFNLNDIGAGDTTIVDVPFTANNSSVGIANVTLLFDSVLDNTHLICKNSKTEYFKIIAA